MFILLRGDQLGVPGKIGLPDVRLDLVVVEGRPDLFRGGHGGKDVALRRRRGRGVSANTSGRMPFFSRGRFS